MAGWEKIIEVCLKQLLSWNKDRLKGSIQQAIERKMTEIEILKKDDNSWNMLKTAEKYLEELLEEEERYWKQRSREDWLNWGDGNTKWFHMKAFERRRKNRIEGVLNKDSDWVVGDDEIGEVASDYFRTLFQTSNLNSSMIDQVLEGTSGKV